MASSFNRLAALPHRSSGTYSCEWKPGLVQLRASMIGSADPDRPTL